VGIRWTGIGLLWWCPPPVNSDSEILAATVACHAVTKRSCACPQAVGTHRDLKELFGILMDELHGVMQFDVIGVSLRDRDSDTFQKYFIDMGSRSEFVPEEQLMPEETLTLWVYERQEPR